MCSELNRSSGHGKEAADVQQGTLRFAGASGASLPRSTIIAIAVAVAGGVVLIGIIVLLGLLWYVPDLCNLRGRMPGDSLYCSLNTHRLGLCPVSPILQHSAHT